MFIFSIVKLKILLLFLIFSTSSFANTTVDIELLLPKTNYRSSKQIILFKGKVKNSSKLTINGHKISLYKSRFYQKVILNPHQENKFMKLISTIYPVASRFCLLSF